MHTFSTTLLLLGLTLLRPTFAADCTWQGGAGAWEAASAWSCNAVPGPSDTAIIGSGTVTLGSTITVRVLTMTGGTLDGTGTLTVTEAFTWEAGVMAGEGSTLVLGATTLRAATSKNVGRTVYLRGATTWSDGTLQMRDGGVLVNEGVFTDNATGTHSIVRAGTIATEPLVLNRGTWSVESVGTNTNVNFANEGTLTITGGGFDVNAPARFSNDLAGTLVGIALLDLSSGPVVSLSGTTRPGGALVGSFPVRGSFPMTSDHVLDVDLTGSGTDGFDRLLVEDGDVTVDGRLFLTFADGFVPTVGQTFAVLTHTGNGSVSGCYESEDIVVSPEAYEVAVACTSEGIVAQVVAVTAGEPGAAPDALSLSAAYPNPFRTSTTLTLTVPTAQRVTVELFDALGRTVATLFHGAVPAGEVYTLTLEAGTLPSGLYVVRARSEGFLLTRRVTLLR